MSCRTIGPLAVALLTGALLAGCGPGDSATDDAIAEVAPGVPAPSPTDEADEQAAKATQETLEARLGALDERLDELEDNASGPQEDAVEELERRRKELADRVDRLGSQVDTAAYDPQEIELELQGLDEDIALMERELLPNRGDVGVEPAPSDT